MAGRARPPRRKGRRARCSPPGGRAGIIRATPQANRSSAELREPPPARAPELPDGGERRREVRLRIKSLEISGFKSFVDRTRFEFRPGHHRHRRSQRLRQVERRRRDPLGDGRAVAAPPARQGHGGRDLRGLRGAPAGRHGRGRAHLRQLRRATRPPAFAAYTEIQVARRLYRAGESEYLINKVPVRLRDVHDFFRDTGIGTRGYTIVEQGRIAEIVSAKPEDRRALIEEAAGIGKYKARRQEAERKLEATDQNLVRVNDVLGEIRRQIATRSSARPRRPRATGGCTTCSGCSSSPSPPTSGPRCSARSRRRAAGALAARDAAAAAETRLAECEARLRGEARRARRGRARRRRAERGALPGARRASRSSRAASSYERRERAALAEANVAREREREELRAQRAGGATRRPRASRDELGGLEAALAAEARAVAEARGRGARRPPRRCASASASATPRAPRSSRC